MPIKFNNTITLRLTNEQTNWLINLMNDNFCINSMADAIRFCINTEMHYYNVTSELYCAETKQKQKKINK